MTDFYLPHEAMDLDVSLVSSSADTVSTVSTCASWREAVAEGVVAAEMQFPERSKKCRFNWGRPQYACEPESPKLQASRTTTLTWDTTLEVASYEGVCQQRVVKTRAERWGKAVAGMLPRRANVSKVERVQAVLPSGVKVALVELCARMGATATVADLCALVGQCGAAWALRTESCALAVDECGATTALTVGAAKAVFLVLERLGCPALALLAAEATRALGSASAPHWRAEQRIADACEWEEC